MERCNAHQSPVTVGRLNVNEYFCAYLKAQPMIDNYFSGSDIQEFRKWMEWADRYVVISHMGPDGDAGGSSLALCRFLRKCGKQCTVVLPDEVPDFLKWLPGFSDVVIYSDDSERAEKLVYDADVVCSLDFNTVKRISGVAASFLYTKAKKIVIDHHPYPGPFFDVTLSHPESSSTSELVFHFICAMGQYGLIDTETAVCLYTGIMTDTGALTYNSSSSGLFGTVSLLLDKGIDKDEIYRNVYHTYSESRLRLQGYVLSEKMQIIDSASAALVTLTDAELKKYNARKGDTEGFVNMPLQIKGILMSAFFREDTVLGIIKLSFRSVGTVPCNRFSQEFFNGGGHVNAAGGEFTGTLQEAVEVFRKGLEKWAESSEECIRQLFVK